MFNRLFRDHPASVNETYFEHMRAAASFGSKMFLGSLACFVHALVPALCTSTGSAVVRKLHDRMVVNRTVHAKPAAPNANEASEASNA